MFGNWNDNQIGIRYFINFNIDGSSYSVFDRNRKFYGYRIYKWNDGEVF